MVMMPFIELSILPFCPTATRDGDDRRETLLPRRKNPVDNASVGLTFIVVSKRATKKTDSTLEEKEVRIERIIIIFSVSVSYSFSLHKQGSSCVISCLTSVLIDS